MDNGFYVSFDDAKQLRNLLIELADTDGDDYCLTTSDRTLRFHRKAEGITLELDELADIVQIMDGEWYNDRTNNTVDITTETGFSCEVIYEGQRIVNCE